MAKSTKVMTPRNVELPKNVMENNIKIGKKSRKRCFCLSVWLFALLLLGIGAAIMINFLITSEKTSKSCDEDSLSIRHKVLNSQRIIVGELNEHGKVLIHLNLKGQYEPGILQVMDTSCLDNEQIFFLKHESGTMWTYAFQSMLPSEHLIQMIQSIHETSEATKVTAAAYGLSDLSCENCDYGLCKTINEENICSCDDLCFEEIKEEKPVCGSDHVTYKNECFLKLARCKKNYNIVVVGNTSCDELCGDLNEENCFKDTSFSLKQNCAYSLQMCRNEPQNLICGTDNKTYDNICLMNYQSCVSFSRIGIAHLGPCSNKTTLCTPNPCLSGGTCDEHDGVFSCYCRSGLTGSRCEHDLSKSEFDLPSFMGLSYVTIKTPMIGVKRLEIEISFQAFNTENGILYYSQSEKETDYLAIFLLNNHVTFEYDLGDGSVTLTSHKNITKNTWHFIVAKRYHQDGLLEVDGLDKVIGSTQGSLRTLDVDSIAWIGGLPPSKHSSYKVLKEHQQYIGLNGCIRELSINKKTIRLQSKKEPLVLERTQIRDCSTNICAKTPCMNDGICSIDESHNFVCTCKKEFAGRKCQRQKNGCEPNPCMNEGLCQIVDNGVVCKCMKNLWRGDYCEISNTTESPINDEPFHQSTKFPNFQTLSFTIKRSLVAYKEFLLKMKIYFNISTEGNLVLYSTKVGLLEIEINEKESLLTSSSYYISDNRWHSVKLHFGNNFLRVLIDGDTVLQTNHSIQLLSFDGITNNGEKSCIKNVEMIQWTSNGRRQIENLPDLC